MSSDRMINDTRVAGVHIQERRVDTAKRALFEDLRADLRNRLSRVCDDWPCAELDRLTARMTRLRLRYEPICALPEQW